MLYKNAKQVVILKNIHSNIFEEVIFVLKNNADVFKNGKNQDKTKNFAMNSDYMIKEAHQIIENYIQQYSRNHKEAVQTPKASSQPLKANKQPQKNKSMGIVLNAALFISISVLILLLSRAL